MPYMIRNTINGRFVYGWTLVKSPQNATIYKTMPVAKRKLTDIKKSYEWFGSKRIGLPRYDDYVNMYPEKDYEILEVTITFKEEDAKRILVDLI